MSTKRITDEVIGSQVEVANLASAAESVLAMAEARRPAFICFTTAFMLVKAATNEQIHRMYRQCDINMPDGMPVAWALRALGNKDAECISGPRLTPLLLREAAARGISVGFYGGRTETLERMEAVLTPGSAGVKDCLSLLSSFPFSLASGTEADPGRHDRFGDADALRGAWLAKAGSLDAPAWVGGSVRFAWVWVRRLNLSRGRRCFRRSGFSGLD